VGLFAPPLATEPDSLPRFPAVGDTSVDVESRARAYLHSNCASCHRPGGSGRGSADFRYQLAFEQMGICNAAPVTTDLGVVDARLLVPGHPERSLIPLRMRRRDAHGMPPLGSNIADAAGVALVEEWILSLSECP
jgi:hypothetical protein